MPNSHRIINRTKIVQSIERLQIPHRLPSHQCMSVGAALPLSVFVLSSPVGGKRARSGPNVACESEPVATVTGSKAADFADYADLIRVIGVIRRQGVVFGFQA